MMQGLAERVEWSEEVGAVIRDSGERREGIALDDRAHQQLTAAHRRRRTT